MAKINAIESAEAARDSAMAEVERLKSLVRMFVSDLPQKRDWLDPAIERELRDAAKGGSAA